MMAKGHKLSGTLAGLPVADAAVAVGAPAWTVLAVVPLCTVAALLPDLDCEGSTATLSLGFVTRVISKVLQLVCRTTYFFTRAWPDRVVRGAHRTLSHTALGCVGFGALTWWLTASFLPPLFAAYAPLWGITVAVGCLAHVFGDMLTMSGCPILWPLKIDGMRWHQVRSPIPFRTDSMVEHMLVVPALRILICVTGGLPLPIQVTDPPILFSVICGLAWNAAVFLFSKRRQYVPVQTSHASRLFGGRKRKRSKRRRKARR